MNRQYINSPETDKAVFFVGHEVEKSPTYGMKTLFVVGVHTPEEVIKKAKEAECEAVYFGANHSFELEREDFSDWAPWEHMIHGTLKHGFWCTLDFDVQYQESFLESGLTEHIKMIPMISVKMPYLEQLGYNATLKIDDIGFNESNPGVWCHRVCDLVPVDKFTHWNEYLKDSVIDL